MHPQADGFLSHLNSFIISSQVLAGLAGAVVVGLAGWVYRVIGRRRRFGWNVLWDEPINQGDPLARPRPAPGGQAAQPGGQQPGPDPNMWEIVYQESAPPAPPHTVTNGSLVVIDMRNIGWQPIRASDFDQQQDFTLRFPGRKVVHFKVRDNARYHEQVHQGWPTPAPGVGDSFTLPALQMNRGDGFKLLVLLESPTPNPSTRYDKPDVDGNIQGGKFVDYTGRPGRNRRVLISAVAVAVIAGTVAGLLIANRALALAPTCASGKLDIEGSTAFAPVFNQVVTEYEQLCPGTQITVRGVGSVKGLEDLEQNTSNTPIIAMYDGLPDPAPGPGYIGQAIGDIILAVVGNRTLPANVFIAGKQGGLSYQQIAQAFQNPSTGPYAPVGRSSASGTRKAFAQQVLNGDDSSEQNAGQCPSASGVCLEDTTMDLLTYVNKTPNAIGYAEADALPFFPGVGAIPINGYEPIRANALNGTYKFLAIEHLYTSGIPAGLTADLINFLDSSAVTAQLRDTSFIACPDLAGSKLSGDCARS